MRRRNWLALAGLATVSTVVGGLLLAPTASAETTTGLRFVDITASDGVVLKANVNEPTSPGKHPAIIFISSWGLNDLEYVAQSAALAQAGYTVVSYTPRGWWQSGGQIDTAGPKDIADVRTVVDWTIANTSADPAHIGASGVSYGAGISLIASAFEPRIKAVAALSAWTDLTESLYGGQTRKQQGAALLQVAADLLGHPSAELNTILGNYWDNTNIDSIKAFARVRSAATYVDAVNANHPAVLIANAYGDSLFGPNQLVDFFGRLTGPKRLELAPGDHAVVELTGLVGLPNEAWTSVRRWFDLYLRGIDTGIGSEPPVVLKSQSGGATESYVDWADVTGSTSRFGLKEVNWLTGTGSLGGSATTGWIRTAYALGDSGASAGVALITNGWAGFTGDLPTIWLPSINRTTAGVWQSSSLSPATNIRGIPRLHLTVKPGSTNGTVVAYLYDTDALGSGDLIAHTVTSWLGAATGTALGLDLAFPATSYTMPSGHRLALVVDTEDSLYLDANPVGAGITFTGPSYLDVPLR